MYDYPLYRPPSEGNSLIIQATLGCSHNKCSFCNMYKSKKFTIKSVEAIKRDIDYYRKIYPYVEKIFLADGDALIMMKQAAGIVTLPDGMRGHDFRIIIQLVFGRGDDAGR